MAAANPFAWFRPPSRTRRSRAMSAATLDPRAMPLADQEGYLSSPPGAGLVLRGKRGGGDPCCPGATNTQANRNVASKTCFCFFRFRDAGNIMTHDPLCFTCSIPRRFFHSQTVPRFRNIERWPGASYCNCMRQTELPV